jgi:hypothetical protein
MEKFIENIYEAEKTIHTIDHMIYVTFPLVKDKKLLIKILLETKIALTKCINSILQYEYIYKRINLYKDGKSNFNTFEKKCAPRYGINKKDIEMILELFEIIKKHKESTMEFTKNEKIIILSENLKTKTVSIDKIKNFIVLSKKILKNTKSTINNNF